MDPAYAQRYRDLHERHWWWRAREARVMGWVRRYCPAPGYGEILDVGCGDGLLLDTLSPYGNPRGLEVDASLVSEAQRDRIHLGPLDASYAPGCSFGLITMLDVLEHIEDDRAALHRAHELMAPGGILLLTVPAHPRLWTHHDTLNHHHRRYRPQPLLRKLEGAGFAPVESGALFHWTVPVKLALRLKERVFGRDEEGERVPAPPVNAALLSLCALEARTWGQLPGLPGSSLYAVARRG